MRQCLERVRTPHSRFVQMLCLSNLDAQIRGASSNRSEFLVNILQEQELYSYISAGHFKRQHASFVAGMSRGRETHADETSCEPESCVPIPRTRETEMS